MTSPVEKDPNRYLKPKANAYLTRPAFAEFCAASRRQLSSSLRRLLGN